jgi:hypothetical protein
MAEKTIRESARDIPVVAEVQVLVVGGGPAGIAAATAAARAGARTMLVERYGYLGGLATGGLVLYMDGLFDKSGERCIGGIHWESLERLRDLGGLAAQTPTRLHVDSELYKVVADNLCVESGVELRLHCWAVDSLVEDGRVTGVIVESKSGREAILADVCVDATGDGDVGAYAGAAYDFGSLRIGLNLKVGGVDREAYQAFASEYPERIRSLRQELIDLGGYPLGAGATPYSDQGVYWVNVIGLADRESTEEGKRSFAGELSAIDVEDLTYAEVELRRRLLQSVNYYRETMPGYENVRLLAFAPQLGVRDSRHIKGEHTLTLAEMEEGRTFDDVIGMTGRTFDVAGDDLHHLQVPYRALVPESIDGLLVGGRCISVDQGLVGPIRIIPPCMMTGQAAGTAAAIAASSGVQPRAVDVTALRRQLSVDGVILP